MIEISSRIVQPGKVSRVSLPKGSRILGIRRKATGNFLSGGVVLDYVYTPPGMQRQIYQVESVCQGIVTDTNPGDYLGSLDYGSHTYFFFGKWEEFYESERSEIQQGQA